MHPMKLQPATVMAALAVLGAAGFALLRPLESVGRENAPAPPTQSGRATDDSAEPTSGFGGPPHATLPPNHPIIGNGASPHGSMAGSLSATDEPPAIAWTVPTDWTALPNPSPMRVATYRVGAKGEMAVARAGGSTDANIQRWIGQFDEPAQVQRSTKTVRGLAIELVEINGAYAGGGMAPGAPSEPHPGWSLLGGVVETQGSHYFFKLLGPRDQVTKAHPSFDALIASIKPL
jgi:hypothetical protein